MLQKTKPQIPFKVTVLVLPESSMMCIASVIEPMRAANRVANEKLYEWQVVSINGHEITMTCDINLVMDDEFAGTLKGDLLVLVAGFNQMAHVSNYALAKLRNAASGFDKIAGVEAGSWLLARAGFLDQHSATTHWEDFESFSEAFPDVDLKYDRYVIDGRYMTCGGASPAFDMFFDLIRRRNGPAIAMEAASVFIYDETRSQFDAQPLLSLGKSGQTEKRLEAAIRLMEQKLEQPLPVAAIAKRTGVSSKTLETVFKTHMDMTPGRFYLNLRLKAANRMVQDTKLSMQEIAVRTGFNSLSAFSRAYAQNFGKTAREVRR